MSDTALMVAACRTLEAESPDGFVHDPFAARLAGERGMAMLQTLQRPEWMRFGVAIRSHFIDELLLQALASNSIATVLSLGCGLDTRPWRLDLPPELRWIEVDFADMLDYKDARMSSEKPRCRRERLTSDVNDGAQRRAIYAALGPAPALMITEGLLMYLPAASVEAIASEPCRESGVAWWMADISTSAFSKAIDMAANRSITSLQAPDFLHGEQIIEMVRRHGWKESARRSYITDMAFAAKRIQKMMGDAGQQAGPPPVPPDDPTGIHLFARR